MPSDRESPPSGNQASIRWSTHRFLLRFFRLVRGAAILCLVIMATLLVARAVDSQRGPPLELWHTYVPDEVHAGDVDRLDWGGYLAAEARVFDAVRSDVTDKLPPEERTPDNRYFAEAPINPDRFAQCYRRREPADRRRGLVAGATICGLVRRYLSAAALSRRGLG